LIYSGRPFSAEEAYSWGLVNRLCEPAALVRETLAVAQAIAANAPIAVRQAKRAIDLGTQMEPRRGHGVRNRSLWRMVGTRTGARESSLQQRQPRFEGR
jgi:enoyl-CoA hydratase/carnithine racemase